MWRSQLLRIIPVASFTVDNEMAFMECSRQENLSCVFHLTIFASNEWCILEWGVRAIHVAIDIGEHRRIIHRIQLPQKEKKSFSPLYKEFHIYCRVFSYTDFEYIRLIHWSRTLSSDMSLVIHLTLDKFSEMLLKNPYFWICKIFCSSLLS